MNTKTTALKKKAGTLGKVTDYFRGISRVDNGNNPASALSNMRRATAAKKPQSGKGLTY